MDEKIIEQIIRRIMTDPSLAALLSSDAAQTANVGGRVLILVNQAPDVEKRLQFLVKSWAETCQLDAVLSPGAEAAGVKLPSGINLVDGNLAWKDLAQWKRLVIPAISQNTLAKLATGVRDGALVELAAKAIEAGMKIDVVPGFTIPVTAPPTWAAMYDGYLQQLRSFKVCVHDAVEAVVACIVCAQPGSCIFTSLVPPGIKPEQVTVPLVAKAADAPLKSVCSTATNQAVYECSAQVLTERDVMGFARNSVVKLAKRTILTPLAKERLGERQVDYFREGE
jgi:hypothetical protein